MITPTDLTCEYATNPISIDTLQPRFSWLLESDRRNQSNQPIRSSSPAAPRTSTPGAATNGTAAR